MASPSTPATPPDGTVYFVRHGLVHNPERIAYGWLPRFRLADEGRAQAAATAEFLAARAIAFVLTSPLLRARQTSGFIAEKLPAVPLRRSRLLIESGLAHYWEGTPWAEIPERHAAVWQQFDKAASTVEAGESLAAMAERMRAAFALALRLSGGAPAVCVSHRDPILALRLAIEGRTFDELHTTTCNPASVTQIEARDGVLRLVEYAEAYVAPPTGRYGAPVRPSA